MCVPQQSAPCLQCERAPGNTPSVSMAGEQSVSTQIVWTHTPLPHCRDLISSGLHGFAPNLVPLTEGEDDFNPDDVA